ncbi:MAG: YajQ family cyclic di-GMP-binding protein [Deltaproteobacteria bacterium RIFCSPLOWO2_02_FULL_46_8]|nr:MAG: YajQ family cyclic di-GMP-binding protein [Deltaproteobacteria bacterium RIFCSPLOWO2_02_FULL_46_8]
MPSFDIVSEVNRQEIDNAVNQSMKEIVTRFDFKGTKSKIILEKEAIQIVSDNDIKMKSVVDILQSKLVKRGVSLKSIDLGKVQPGADGLSKCTGKIIAGIDQDKGKELVKKIKEMNLKVQASIQETQVRVTGKNRDDLQTVIANLRATDFPIPLQFINFRE